MSTCVCVWVSTRVWSCAICPCYHVSRTVAAKRCAKLKIRRSASFGMTRELVCICVVSFYRKITTSSCRSKTHDKCINRHRIFSILYYLNQCHGNQVIISQCLNCQLNLALFLKTHQQIAWIKSWNAVLTPSPFGFATDPYLFWQFKQWYLQNDHDRHKYV